MFIDKCYEVKNSIYIDKNADLFYVKVEDKKIYDDKIAILYDSEAKVIIKWGLLGFVNKYYSDLIKISEDPDKEAIKDLIKSYKIFIFNSKEEKQKDLNNLILILESSGKATKFIEKLNELEKLKGGLLCQ